MKLGKLLGAGKSFFGGGGSVSYRTDKNVYLPKFNSAKNPFTPKTEKNPIVSESKKVSVPVAAKTQKIPTLAPKPVRATNWTTKLNPFRAPETEAPILNAEQTELSLNAVKVLHNDLSDADVEIVPMKSRPAAPAKVAANPMDFLGEPVLKTI